MSNRKSGKKYSKNKPDKNKSGKNKSSKNKVKISLKKGGAGAAMPNPLGPVLAPSTPKPQEELKKVLEELKEVKERLNKLEKATPEPATVTTNTPGIPNSLSPNNTSSTQPDATDAEAKKNCSIM